jgi:AraC-like DNA-binding protein
MNIKEFIPIKQLKPYVKCFKIIESEFETINRVLPNNSSTIAFQLQGKISYIENEIETELPTAFFTGYRKTPRIINYKKNTKSLIVQFTEIGACSIFGSELFEIFGKSVPLNVFLKKEEKDNLETKLNETENNRQLICVAESFLLSKLSLCKIDKLIEKSLSDIYRHNGIIQIKDLANTFFISQDAFEKRFRKTIGTSPKKFASIVQLNSIIKREPQNSLTEFALECGFYDQAHFNHSFKVFTGTTPSKFYNTLSDFC